MWTRTNKILGIIFIITTIALILDFALSGNKHTAMPDTLVKTDTADIAKIAFYPSGKDNSTITLQRNGNTWEVVSKGKKYPADQDKIRSILETIAGMRPTQVVANSRKQWPDYGVADTNSLNILIYNKRGKLITHLFVGKIKTAQVQTSYPYPGQNQSYYTYVRRSDDKNVYLVPKLLAITFINDPNAYRDQTIINVDQLDIQSITIAQQDKKYTLKREAGGWTINGDPVDSLSMVDYLRDISHMQGWQFAPDSTVKALKENKTLTLGLRNGHQITVKGLGDTAVSVIWSSQNPGSYFKAAALDKRLFKPAGYFQKKSKE